MSGIDTFSTEKGMFLTGGVKTDKLINLLGVERIEELETMGINYIPVDKDFSLSNISNVAWSDKMLVNASNNYYTENALRREYDMLHMNDCGYKMLGVRMAYVTK